MQPAHLALLGALILPLVLATAAGAADQAPDFTLPDLEGTSTKLSAVYAEGPVVLSFWATWCVPCPEEMKHLQRLHERYREQGLHVLAPAIDGSKTVSKVRPFALGRRFTYPVLLDTNNDVKRLYSVAVVPTVFLIDKSGAIVYRHVGYRPGDEVELEKEIQKVLSGTESGGEGAPPPATSTESSAVPEVEEPGPEAAPDEAGPENAAPPASPTEDPKKNE